MGADSASPGPVHTKVAPVVRLTGTGATWWDKLQRLSPGTLERIARNIDAARSSDVLEPKVRELIYIGVDALVTHLYPSGISVHIENALKQGASVEEVIEALQIACAISTSSYVRASKALDDALAEAGVAVPQFPAATDEADFCVAFEEKTGVREPWMDLSEARAPGYLQSLLDVGYSPNEASAVGRKNRALISVSLAASPPIADHDAVRCFARAALKFGATAEELYEAVHLTAALGGHAFSIGAPALAKILEESQAGAR